MIKFRKQIYVDKEDMTSLQSEGQRKHNSVSAVIREAIKEHLYKEQQRPGWQEDPVTKLIGQIDSMTRQGSSRHDQYIYE